MDEKSATLTFASEDAQTAYRKHHVKWPKSSSWWTR